MATFTMPSLGADMDSGTLLEWLVKPGDMVHRGDVVAVVDTSKAAVEVETFADGVVEELLVPVGTHAAVGTPLARIGDGARPRGPATTAEPRPAARAPSPPVRHLARELGIDLAAIHGTGAGGAVTRRDVERAAASTRVVPAQRAQAPATPPSAAPSAVPPRAGISPYARRLARELGVDLATLPTDRPIHAADVRRAVAGAPAAGPTAVAPAPVTRPESTAAPDLRHTIAHLMSRSKREVPHYYLSTTVDLQAAIAWMTERNLALPLSDRLVPAALLLKATALAARAHPQLNGFWVDETFRPGPGIHVGVAISMRTGGLVAPAIHDAADLGVEALMVALRDLVGRARVGRLRGSELADPTLTVTNLGDQGVEAVLGVIYPPQVALVGFGRVVDRPVAVDGLLGVHPTTTASLSADHRATDGFVGARFLDTIDRLLQRPEEL